MLTRSVYDQRVPLSPIGKAYGTRTQTVVAGTEGALRQRDDFEWMLGEVVVLVPEVKFRQRVPRVGEGTEIRCEGDARQALGEIVRKPVAVVW